jgi:hypothetical protein
VKTQITPFTDAKGNHGYVCQGYDPATATYVMEDALMTSERWVDHEPPLVEGKGLPAFTLQTLITMKRFEIAAGSLRHLHVWGNHHVESVLQLAQRERNGQSLAEAVVETTSYLSIETPMIQSGHQITSVRVEGGRRDSVANLLRWHERRITAFEHTPPDRSAEHAALLAKMGRSTDEIVLFDYELFLELAPYGPL